jgi:hypothetical protein
MGTSNSELYNWEMTGPPDEVTIATNPEAVADWNEYVADVNAGQAGYGGGLPPEAIANPIYEDPTYWNSGLKPYTGGDGKTYYAENFLSPEAYVSMGYAAPYTREQLLAAVNPENIRYGYRNTPYAGIFNASGESAGEYVVDPQTGRFLLDQSGNPINVPREPSKSGGFDSFMEKAIPALLFAGAAGTGLGALGLLGAGGLAGAGTLGATGEAAAAATSLTGNAFLDSAIASSALKGAGYGALTGGVTSALTGQDALKGALIGGATGGILGGGEAVLLPGVAEAAKGSVAASGLLGAGRGAAGGAINTLLGGGDLKKNILYGGALGGTIGAGSEYFFPTAPTSVTGREGEAPRWASIKDSLQNAEQSLDYFNNLKVGEVSNMGYAGEPYSGLGLNPAVRTGGGYDVLSPEYITNRGGYGAGGYSGIGLDPAIEQLYGGIGLNPNLNYNTAGLANTAEALSQASGVDINRAEFAGRGGLTADQEAALDRALTAADYATPTSWFSGLGNLGTMLGMGALGRGAGGGGGAAAKGAAGGSFVPKGMVDYSGILNLLAPKTSTRSSLLG